MGSIKIDVAKLLQIAENCLKMADKLKDATHCLISLQNRLSPSKALTKEILLLLNKLKNDLQIAAAELKKDAAILETVAEIFAETEEEILYMVKSLPCEDIFSQVNSDLLNLQSNILKQETFLIHSPIQAVSSNLISNHTLSHSDWLIQMIMGMWRDS